MLSARLRWVIVRCCGRASTPNEISKCICFRVGIWRTSTSRSCHSGPGRSASTASTPSDDAPPRGAAPLDRSRGREVSPEVDLRKLLPPRQRVPAAAVSQWPPLAGAAPGRRFNPQAIGTSFLGIQLSDTAFAIPPDSMGNVGPTQILAITNGRIRVFDKSGTVGGLDTDTDNFFASVGGLDFATADPHVRYDRLSGRWFVTMIDLGVFGGLGIPLGPNGIMIAVTSGSTITSGSSFTFFRFEQDLVGQTPNSDTDGF